MRNYLKIKNAIISILVTAIYLSWLINGLNVYKIVIACATVFVSMFSLLVWADKIYINTKKEKRSESHNENRK